MPAGYLACHLVPGGDFVGVDGDATGPARIARFLGQVTLYSHPAPKPA